MYKCFKFFKIHLKQSWVKFRKLRVFLFIYLFILINVFFDVDSKSTIGFRRSIGFRHVVFEL